MTKQLRLFPGLASVLILASTLVPAAAEKLPPGPEGLVGFSGQVRGVVVEKREKHGVEFKVARVLKTWKNNKATRPESLSGRTVPVGPAWVRHDDGKWHPVEKHIHFLKSLKPGEVLTLELRHAEREHFAILELTGDQRERAAKGGTSDHQSEKGKEAELAELRREIERLKAENRELRKKR